ncbi:uncharacterized protein EDB93DRAFT_1106586 [Suillus bovinus]|uniref:uncharacterized protein n=1 Tax=Suillus bovinus TaxID=48563 RepID=UPI001B860375|nr:uncharacterized protein EDB93DRAFT_1106586 [Suillus bovinus]KAG2137635.1 hypothetical protein EDB93DRAFT_1106586 [Suillus bovinus]
MELVLDRLGKPVKKGSGWIFQYSDCPQQLDMDSKPAWFDESFLLQDDQNPGPTLQILHAIDSDLPHVSTAEFAHPSPAVQTPPGVNSDLHHLGVQQSELESSVCMAWKNIYTGAGTLVDVTFGGLGKAWPPRPVTLGPEALPDIIWQALSPFCTVSRQDLVATWTHWELKDLGLAKEALECLQTFHRKLYKRMKDEHGVDSHPRDQNPGRQLRSGKPRWGSRRLKAGPQTPCEVRLWTSQLREWLEEATRTGDPYPENRGGTKKTMVGQQERKKKEGWGVWRRGKWCTKAQPGVDGQTRLGEEGALSGLKVGGLTKKKQGASKKNQQLPCLIANAHAQEACLQQHACVVSVPAGAVKSPTASKKNRGMQEGGRVAEGEGEKKRGVGRCGGEGGGASRPSLGRMAKPGWG